MAREPDWTRGEFETILAHPELSHEELAEVLETRSAGAVAVVRQGVHAYHDGHDFATKALSGMMRAVLTTTVGTLRCQVCGDGF